MSLLMIPLTILYDGYIDRSKLSEQKKPVEQLSIKFFPPQEGSEQLINVRDLKGMLGSSIQKKIARVQITSLCFYVF